VRILARRERPGAWLQLGESGHGLQRRYLKVSDAFTLCGNKLIAALVIRNHGRRVTRDSKIWRRPKAGIITANPLLPKSKAEAPISCNNSWLHVCSLASFKAVVTFKNGCIDLASVSYTKGNKTFAV